MARPVHPVRSKHDKRTQSVVDAVEGYDLSESSSWSDLDALSAHTYVDGVEVDPEGVIFEGKNRFSGVLNVYVLLRYGSKEDRFETTDAFLGRFQGHFDEKEKPVIEDVSVDTSPFYEGEPDVAEG